MRILLAMPSYPSIGGVEYVVKSTAERFAALRHETTVVTGDTKADKPLEEEINGVHVIRWPTWAPSGAYHIPKKRNQLEKLSTDTARGPTSYMPTTSTASLPHTPP
jgi:glycosyltransferase involved in cell wall biosynthesis